VALLVSFTGTSCQQSTDESVATAEVLYKTFPLPASRIKATLKARHFMASRAITSFHQEGILQTLRILLTLVQSDAGIVYYA
jgi:hypothetical protein